VMRQAQAPPVLRVEHRPAVRDWVFVIRQLREGQLAVLITPHTERMPAPVLCRDLPPDVIVAPLRSRRALVALRQDLGRPRTASTKGLGHSTTAQRIFFPIASRKMAFHSVAPPLLAILNPTPLSLRGCRHVCGQSRSKEGIRNLPPGRAAHPSTRVSGDYKGRSSGTAWCASHRLRTDSTSQGGDVGAALSIELDTIGTVPHASAKRGFLLVCF
jgi:hypothetical protein